MTNETQEKVESIIQEETIRCAEIAESFLNSHWKKYLAYKKTCPELALEHKNKSDVARLIYNEILGR